jgi:hypothetical protein
MKMAHKIIPITSIPHSGEDGAGKKGGPKGMVGSDGGGSQQAPVKL